MSNVKSNRILPTSSSYARDHFLYVQEIGTLTSQSPHISTRNNIYSFLFLVVTNGSGSFSYMGKTRSIHAGDCVFIDCREPYSHESSGDDPWTLTWVHFYGKDLPDFYMQYRNMGFTYFFHPVSLANILSTLSNLYHEQEHKSSTTEIMSHKYLTDIVVFAFAENREEEKESVSMNEKLQQIREYMSVHYSEKITLNSLAGLFYISKFHLSREYKRFFGVTIMNDLTSLRISQAKSLLRFTDRSIEQIAEECGFLDGTYFIKVFKSAENMTPYSYRTKW